MVIEIVGDMGDWRKYAWKGWWDSGKTAPGYGPKQD